MNCSNSVVGLKSSGKAITSMQLVVADGSDTNVHNKGEMNTEKRGTGDITRIL